MKLSRRALLGTAVGAAQLALLDRFAPHTARAAPSGNGPTRYLGILVKGGLPFEQLFAPLTGAGINKFIPNPIQDQQPFGYLPAQVQNWDGSAADLNSPDPKRKIRGPIYWKAGAPNVPYQPEAGMNPLSGGVQRYSEYGYSLVDPKFSIFKKMAVLAAVDQGTASHLSGVIGSTCGVADNSFRAPAVAAVIANFLLRTPGIADRRPLANVALGDALTPASFNLPSAASPARVANLASLVDLYSERNANAWKGLSARTGDRSKIDEAVAAALMSVKGTAGAGADSDFAQLLASYEQVSKTLHRDIVTKLEATKDWEYLHNGSNGPRYSTPDWSATVGRQFGSVNTMGPFATALRLLKSDLVTSVTMKTVSVDQFDFDVHRAFGQYDAAANLRVVFEQIARLLIEMQLTPAPGSPGKSLLDDTLVYVYSDFGRTFPKSFNDSKIYTGGSDHHPATCAVLAGGGIGSDGTGNTMIGGYDESVPALTSPMGVPVEIKEEGGNIAKRAPRSQDVVARSAAPMEWTRKRRTSSCRAASEKS
jgi:Protein of unknown function (DUF1501)